MAGVFALLFLLLGPLVSALRLYVDDYPYLLDTPRLTTDFYHFIVSYAQVHGIYRPVAQLWYWIIYSLYELSPAIAHLIPWGIHCASGWLLSRTLIKHGLIPSLAILMGISYILFPFSVEQYGWLSATPGTLAFIIFLMQLFFIESNLKEKIAQPLFFLLSVVSIFLYESTFFLPFAILFLRTNRPKHTTRWLGIIVAPIVLYATSKLILQGTDSRPLVNSFTGVLNQWNNFIDTASRFIWGYPEHIAFWGNFTSKGLDLALQSSYILVFGTISALSIFWLIKTTHTHYNHPRHEWLFWLGCFILSIPPLLANKEFYFGLRSLILPAVFGSISLLFFFQNILGNRGKYALVGIMGIICIQWLAMDVNLLTSYRQQYDNDIKLSTSIYKQIQSYLTTYPTALLLTSAMPFDSKNTFLHADYLLSCYFYEWSAPSCLKLVTQAPLIVSIKHADGRIAVPKGYTWDGLHLQAPRIELSVSDNGSVAVSHTQ